MTYLPLALCRYIPLFPIALVGSLFCIVFAPVICLFMDNQYYLPWWLKWFEPVDTANGCLDTLWAERSDHNNWSPFKLCYTFLQRNPFYGAESTILANRSSSQLSIYGNPLTSDTEGVAGYFLLVRGGSFQFKSITPSHSLKGFFIFTVFAAIFALPFLYGGLGLFLLAYGVAHLWYSLALGGTCIINEAGWQIKDNNATFGSYLFAPIRFFKFGV